MGANRVLPLGDPSTLDAAVAGGKAAGLARAMVSGLPVVRGVVVPADVFTETIRSGVAALTERNSAAARLAVHRSPIDPSVGRAVRAAHAAFRFGAVVRSSSPSEGDPRWSGAFATYHQVIADDLENAMNGCVASLFSNDALARSAQLGVEPSSVGMAVLVQPWIEFDGGGTAMIDRDRSVLIHAVRGDPAGLVGGRTRGVDVTERLDGTAEGDLTLGGLGSGVARGVASLMRSVGSALGQETIEWGALDGEVTLLQVGRSAAASAPVPYLSVPAPARRPTEPELSLARLALRFPAPMGERFVLPWAVALEALPNVPAAVVTQPMEAIEEIRRIADALQTAVWEARSFGGSSLSEAWAMESRRILADPLGGEPFVRPEPVAGPDGERVATILGLVGGVAHTLVARGSLAHADQLWRLSEAELNRAAMTPGYQPVVPYGPDRWEPFVAAVVAADGDRHTATPVAAGSGCGRVHRLVAGVGRPGPRAVLVARDPVPQIAPLLWGCAGLVTTGGSEAAHLFEVARSLGVPAVTGLSISALDAMGSDAAVAVDGDLGTVTVLEDAPVVAELVGAGA